MSYRSLPDLKSWKNFFAWVLQDRHRFRRFVLAVSLLALIVMALTLTPHGVTFLSAAVGSKGLSGLVGRHKRQV
jgi:hypothetical protein